VLTKDAPVTPDLSLFGHLAAGTLSMDSWEPGLGPRQRIVGMVKHPHLDGSWSRHCPAGLRTARDPAAPIYYSTYFWFGKLASSFLGPPGSTSQVGAALLAQKHLIVLFVELWELIRKRATTAVSAGEKYRYWRMPSAAFAAPSPQSDLSSSTAPMVNNNGPNYELMPSWPY